MSYRTNYSSFTTAPTGSPLYRTVPQVILPMVPSRGLPLSIRGDRPRAVLGGLCRAAGDACRSTMGDAAEDRDDVVTLGGA